MSEFTPGQTSSRKTAPQDLVAQLKLELGGDERLIWSGSPVAGKLFVAAFAIYFFAIPWTAFSLFWESMALSVWFAPAKTQGPETGMLVLGIVFPLFGLPFVGIGLWLLSLPFRARARAGKILYAITSQRAIIACFDTTRIINSYPLQGMESSLERVEKADGSGSLFVGKRTGREKNNQTFLMPRGFEYVENVAAVEAKLRSAIAQAGHS